MSQRWYVKYEGRVLGPLSSKKLRELASDGRINEETIIRQGDRREWVAACRVRGLFKEQEKVSVSRRESDLSAEAFANEMLAAASQPELPPSPIQAEIAVAPKVKQCPFCAEEIAADARKCKHCSEYLDPVLQRQAAYQHARASAQPSWSPGVAAVLSFLFPGLGQIYKGEVGKGIALFLGTGVGYLMFVFPGLLLHLVCIIEAASGDPRK